MKTQCLHCHTKFKVADEHKGKKAKCPKCGNPFVLTPLVEEPSVVKLCTNCGATIPKLDQASLFEGNLVCSKCDEKLRRDSKVSVSEKSVASQSPKPFESQEINEEKLESYVKLRTAAKKSYNRKSFYWGIPGIILQSVGFVMVMNYVSQLDMTTYQQEPLHITFARLILLLGSILLLVGFAYYAKMKGRSPAWCLVGFLGLIGLIILACLKDEFLLIPESAGESLLPAAMDKLKAFTGPGLSSTKTSGLAIASFILGILSITCIFFLFVPSLILGIVALKKISRSAGELHGRGFAIAGIVLSGVGGFIFFIFIFIFIFTQW